MINSNRSVNNIVCGLSDRLWKQRLSSTSLAWLCAISIPISGANAEPIQRSLHPDVTYIDPTESSPNVQEENVKQASPTPPRDESLAYAPSLEINGWQVTCWNLETVEENCRISRKFEKGGRAQIEYLSNLVVISLNNNCSSNSEWENINISRNSENTREVLIKISRNMARWLPLCGFIESDNAGIVSDISSLLLRVVRSKN